MVYGYYKINLALGTFQIVLGRGTQVVANIGLDLMLLVGHERCANYPAKHWRLNIRGIRWELPSLESHYSLLRYGDISHFSLSATQQPTTVPTGPTATST